ncbi:LANO_0D05402g1_1 [Lachancea nothofagi CBS 11611]|uniref:LANO_0D05402g1_1 n=1 Tax=Lachancea nothofagi CBS 11611 TaxID=1266666 RepID=A0A1G4JH13_9SACH|nr:LANO_0D05402g1_1 [Lachancea nothofagi CBS 11611]
MFLAFYITNLKHVLIFQQLLSYDSPSFKSLWTKVQSVAPESSNGEVWFKADLGKNLQVYKSQSESSDLIYWCLVTRQPNPLEPMVFLEAFDTTLLNYFDKEQLAITKLINNQDRVALLLNCMVDANEPAILNLNRLKEMVPNREDLAKIFNSTASTISNRIQNSDSSQIKSSGFSTQPPVGANRTEHQVVPWRSPGTKHSNNELYVDMMEKVHLVLHKSSKTGHLNVVRGLIEGAIDFRSQLTGDPVVAVNLELHGHDLGIPSLHQCCEGHQQDQRLDELQFVPPDGKFQLMQYVIDLEAFESRSKLLANIGLVSVDYDTRLGPLGDEFEIRVNIAGSQHTKHIDDLAIAVNFNAPSLTSECKIKVLRNTHGHFENSVDNSSGHWIFDKQTPTGTLPVLRGCLENASPDQIKSLNLTVHFSCKGELPSGIKVRSVNILSGIPRNVTPFKGVKYTAKTGDYHLR